MNVLVRKLLILGVCIGFPRVSLYHLVFSARRIVESVFGIICSRFRIFQRPLIGTEEHCTLIVSAALVGLSLLPIPR